MIYDPRSARFEWCECHGLDRADCLKLGNAMNLHAKIALHAVAQADANFRGHRQG